MCPDGSGTTPSAAIVHSDGLSSSFLEDEGALVAAVVRKDRKATAELVARYADSICAYVRHRLAPRTDVVDDLVQDVFLAALEHLHTFAGGSSLRAWLLGVARHKVEDYYRTRLRESETLSELDDESTPAVSLDFDAHLDRARMKEKTRRTLAQLPEPYSLALLWRYWELRSAREMAAQTGRTEKAIERLLARARAQFKQIWEAE